MIIITISLYSIICFLIAEESTQVTKSSMFLIHKKSNWIIYMQSIIGKV